MLTRKQHELLIFIDRHLRSTGFSRSCLSPSCTARSAAARDAMRVLSVGMSTHSSSATSC